jgi:hypothetical protein
VRHKEIKIISYLIIRQVKQFHILLALNIPHGRLQSIKKEMSILEFCYCNKVWMKMKFFSLGKSTEIPEVEFRQQSMQLSNQFHLVPMSRMYEVLPPLHHRPSRYMSYLYLYLVIT